MLRLSFFFFIISILSLNTFADTPVNFEDTDVRIYMECQKITARHYKSRKKTAKFTECFVKSGGKHFKKETAPRRYFYKDKAFTGAVDRTSKGYVFYSPKDIEQKRVKASKSVPSRFSCDKNLKNENQCMICDCFYSDRDKTFDEQVMKARVTHSQVISPSFPNSACEIVYSSGSRKWTNAKKVILGEKSKDLSPSYKKQYRRCVRSVKKASKMKNHFFAAYSIGKKEKDPEWLKTCNRDMKSRKVLLNEDQNLMNYHDWKNDYYKICSRKENRCLTYDTCKASTAELSKKEVLKLKKIKDSLLL